MNRLERSPKEIHKIGPKCANLPRNEAQEKPKNSQDKPVQLGQNVSQKLAQEIRQMEANKAQVENRKTVPIKSNKSFQ